jgi:hypothetical protein
VTTRERSRRLAFRTVKRSSGILVGARKSIQARLVAGGLVDDLATSGPAVTKQPHLNEASEGDG